VLNLLLPFQLLLFSKTSIIGFIFLFITSGKKIFYRFILTVLIAFLPLTFVSLKGFSIDFYNASIEFIFLLIFIYGFVSFNIIFRELPFYLILIEKNKLIYNLVYSISLILVSIFLGHESFLIQI